MSDWYVYDEAGAHRGPLSTDALAEAIRARLVPRDALVTMTTWFEEPGRTRWHRIDDVPEIVEKLTALSAGALRVVDGGFAENRLGRPEFGRKVMMVGSSRPPPNENDE